LGETLENNSTYSELPFAGTVDFQKDSKLPAKLNGLLIGHQHAMALSSLIATQYPLLRRDA